MRRCSGSALQERMALGVMLSTALFFGVLSACGSSTSQRRQPSWRTSQPGNGSEPAVQTQFIELAATGRPVPMYNAAHEKTVPASALADAIVSAVGEASIELGRKAPVADARLYQALTELAEVAPVDIPLTYSLIEFAMQRNGIIEPSPHLIIIWGSINDPDSILAQLAPRLPSILGSGSFGRIGIGTASRGKNGDLILLAFQETHLSTNAVPRELPAAGSVRIDGTLSRRFSEPHVYHTTESGEVETLPVTRDGATGFRVRFSCVNHKGKQQVEITASDSTGSTVLANFPIWCGDKAPNSFRVTVNDDDAPPASREEAEERMFDLVNEDRRKHGLADLMLEPRLVPVSRSHSDEMLRTGEVAHVSPTTGSAVDRVKSGGVGTAVVLENVARAYGIGEAQEGLMNSPGHRANILSREVTHMGIGITLGEEVSGRRELLVTQVFIRVATPINVKETHRVASAKIQSTKKMRADAKLAAVARDFASNLAAGLSTSEASAIANKGLDQTANSFTRVSTLVTTVADINAFDPRGALGGPKVSHYGLGVAQGNHVEMGEGAIFVVVLLGQK